MEPDHGGEGGAGTSQFQHEVAAEAVADRGDLCAVRLRLREKDVQARAGKATSALGVVPQRIEPDHHGFPVGHGLVSA